MALWPDQSIIPPRHIGVADFNRNGQKDLLVIYGDENLLKMFLGQKIGSFIGEAMYSNGLSSSPSSFALADLNNDSRLDALVNDIDTNSFAVFLGFNQARFNTQLLNTTNEVTRYSPVYLMDFDGDHHADVIIWISQTTFGGRLGDEAGRLQDPKYNGIQNYQGSGYLLKDVNNDG